MDLTGKKHVFVYGTLMKGFGNERVIAAFPHENYQATISNVEMYNVGHFPALVKGDHSYQGELVVFDESVDPKQLYAHMDRLEGYNANSPETSMYLREPVTVVVDGQEIETEVYFWNYSTRELTYIDPDKYHGYRDFCKGY